MYLLMIGKNLKSNIMGNIKSFNPVFKSKRNWKLRKVWYWIITANNGKIIGKSTETYHNLQDCIYNMKSVGRSITRSYNIES